MFRFTIRDVLWLTVVVGLGVGWWADNDRIDAAAAQLEKERKLQREASDDEREVLVDYRKRLAKDYSELTGGRKLPDLPRRVKPRRIEPGE